MNASDIAFTDQEMRTLTAVARRVARIGGNYVEHDDVRAHLLMWMWEHQDKLEKWRDEEKPPGYLNGALYKQGLTYLSHERALRTGSSRDDFTYYSTGVLREILPDVWDLDDWLPGQGQTTGRSQSRPAESGNRLAMLCDVSSGISVMSEEDRTVLHLRFRDGHTDAECAELWGLTQSGAFRRIDRVLTRLSERLGGPPPWWTGERHARSNARAQAEVE